MTGRTFSRMMKIFYVLIGPVVTRVYILVKKKKPPNVHLRFIHFTVCKLNLNKELLKFTHDVI